mmetsp:Transcript_11644/g.25171  ORF Transcript_11644/g.25171 Transcript_11644/m.25171 type:complete len:233 (-) Transcript_11644:910-1608(-)
MRRRSRARSKQLTLVTAPLQLHPPTASTQAVQQLHQAETAKKLLLQQLQRRRLRRRCYKVAQLAKSLPSLKPTRSERCQPPSPHRRALFMQLCSQHWRYFGTKASFFLAPPLRPDWSSPSQSSTSPRPSPPRPPPLQNDRQRRPGPQQRQCRTSQGQQDQAPSAHRHRPLRHCQQLPCCYPPYGPPPRPCSLLLLLLQLLLSLRRGAESHRRPLLRLRLRLWLLLQRQRTST